MPLSEPAVTVTDMVNPGTVPALGMCFDRTFPPALLPPYARRLEEGGLDELWVIEDCFYTGGVSLAAAALATTSRLRVGLGILPAVARTAPITAMVGKWHLGGLPNFGPLKSGYDEFWGNRGGGVDYFTHKVGDNPDLWDGEVRIEQVGYYTDLLANRSIRFLEERARGDKPWLLSLHFTAPHWPWEGNNEAGRRESARLENVTVPGTLNITHYDGGTLQTYGEMVTSLDANVGRVLARLAELGMERDTVVVFTSDNGGERFSDTWPFSGMKTELLEGGVRVPFIVKWPGLAAPGSTTDEPALSMDFLPTFLASAGGEPHPDYPSDGIDIRPALAGGKLPERTLFWRFHSKDQKAARRGAYKYLSINGNEFLFNVIEDPLERGNLKDRMPEKFAELKAAFDSWSSGMQKASDVSSFGWTPELLADHYGQPTLNVP